MKFLFVLLLWPLAAVAADRFELLDYPPVDRTGHADASEALARAIAAANLVTARGEPACVHIPPGTYRIAHAPPEFARAGCVHGDGSTQSVLLLDRGFAGDLFVWSEAWAPTTPGPTVTGLKIVGGRQAPGPQNALLFYDRIDNLFLDDVEIDNLPGRALYSGATRHAAQAYLRESHLRSLRFFDDGAPGIPVVEFSSAGTGRTDASNEIRLSQVDIYGPHGPGFVIRNSGEGVVRAITAEALRIEGTENGDIAADLLTIGDPAMRGNVNTIDFSDLELIDPYRGFAALRLTAAPGAEAPYQVSVTGWIGGGEPHGEGLRIDAGRSSIFRFSAMHTEGTNVVIGPGMTQVLLDGGGREACWSFCIDPTSAAGVASRCWRKFPLRSDGMFRQSRSRAHADSRRRLNIASRSCYLQRSGRARHCVGDQGAGI
jgi:hypothetical protein